MRLKALDDSAQVSRLEEEKVKAKMYVHRSNCALNYMFIFWQLSFLHKTFFVSGLVPISFPLSSSVSFGSLPRTVNIGLIEGVQFWPFVLHTTIVFAKCKTLTASYFEADRYLVVHSRYASKVP